MVLSTSPRKVVPLNGSSNWEGRPRSRTNSTPAAPTLTRRAFFCGVVVEGPSDGENLSEDVQELVASLGERVSPDELERDVCDESMPSSTSSGKTHIASSPDDKTLADHIYELISTERSYVNRLRILKESYADPLRSYARSKETALLPAYDAKVLFGNIDQLLPVNEAFLRDLETLVDEEGRPTGRGVGDIALHHFKALRAFECYKQYYSKREEAQLIFKRETGKKGSSFGAFIERIKYSTADTKNRVGLRELLMEPIQRVPRYTLMFPAIIKHMHLRDPQRIKLIEANEIASKIALAEADDSTKRAAIMYCLGASIEGFPPSLISNNRRFVDCIDVEDVPTDSIFNSSASINSAASGSGPLHCTLLLFDDKLVIVKRPNGDRPGRALMGLDDLDKFTNGSGFPKGALKKAGLSCKGVFDVTDLAATSVEGPDMQIYLENPPLDQSDRWNGRPFRTFTIVHPPFPANHDPLRTENDKTRFLRNLWNAQALYRAKAGQSVVLCSGDREVESKSSSRTIARAFFNIYQRTPFLKETRKTKVVLHIDSDGDADPIPFGLNSPPYVVIRVQPLPGEWCKYTVTTCAVSEEPEEEVVPTDRVPAKVIQTIHQYGLFKFRTNNPPSRPTTPTTSTRSRAHIFGIDAISRNFFKGDFFAGGTIGSHRRSRTMGSRTSTNTDSTMITATDSLLKQSHRSVSTVATSLADEDSFLDKSPRKLVKRTKSPGPYRSGNESERNSPSRPRSRSVSTHLTLQDLGPDEDIVLGNFALARMNQSEVDLARRLELARKNSLNYAEERHPHMPVNMPVAETIYEEAPPLPTRPLSRMSSKHEEDYVAINNVPTRPTTPVARTLSPTKDMDRRARSPQGDRRPLGPPAPSPLPPVHSLHTGSTQSSSDTAIPQRNGSVLRHVDEPNPSPIPRSRRQPFTPSRSTNNAVVEPEHSQEVKEIKVEPLIIKKRMSVNPASPIARGRNSQARAYQALALEEESNSPTTPTATVPPESLARPTIIKVALKEPTESKRPELANKLIRLAETTSEELQASLRAVKRIRSEIESLSSQKQFTACQNEDEISENSPTQPHGRHGVSTQHAVNREVTQRMQEMHKLIGQRRTVATPRVRPLSVHDPRDTSMSAFNVREWCSATLGYVDETDTHLSDGRRTCESVRQEAEAVGSELNSRDAKITQMEADLRSTKRQCELMKNLLSDATTENEIMYEAFNEELDGMFNDANLPDDDAWTAMTEDLRQTKAGRNNLSKENAQLKRQVQELKAQNEEWAALLREHGLIL